MSLPIIQINNSTGSDTAASGAGPATALTGTLAATHANTTANITDAVDLSGVATDGSAALWVLSSSGRQFSKIRGCDSIGEKTNELGSGPRFQGVLPSRNPSPRG